MNASNYHFEVMDDEEEFQPSCWRCNTPTTQSMQLTCTLCKFQLKQLNELKDLFEGLTLSSSNNSANNVPTSLGVGTRFLYLSFLVKYSALFLYVTDFFEKNQQHSTLNLQPGLKWIKLLLELQVHKKRMELSRNFTAVHELMDMFDQYCASIVGELCEFPQNSFDDFYLCQRDLGTILLKLREFKHHPFDRETNMLIGKLECYERDMLMRCTSQFVKEMDKHGANKSIHSYYFVDAAKDNGAMNLKLWSIQTQLSSLKESVKMFELNEKLKGQLYPK